MKYRQKSNSFTDNTRIALPRPTTLMMKNKHTTKKHNQLVRLMNEHFHPKPDLLSNKPEELLAKHIAELSTALQLKQNMIMRKD